MFIIIIKGIFIEEIELLIGGNIKLFEAFSYKPDDSNIMYSIVSISSKTGPLIENYRNLDYFFIISGVESATINKRQIIDKVKSPIFMTSTVVEIKLKKEKDFFQTILQQLWI